MYFAVIILSVLEFIALLVYLLSRACGHSIRVIGAVSISASKCILASSASSHFLADLLNEDSASGDMQQTCRKASCGRCPWDEPDPYLVSQLQGDYSGVQLCSCKHSCTDWTALRPLSCVVKPARKQGLICLGKSTKLHSAHSLSLFLSFFRQIE